MTTTTTPPRRSFRPVSNWHLTASESSYRAASAPQMLNRSGVAWSILRLAMKFFCWMLGGAVVWAALTARAINPGDEVVVVYNSLLPESKTIAEYYAQKRQVPTNQIFGFELSTNEEMSRGEY